MIDERVEKYMPPVRAAIKRYVKNRDAFTDIYNRAYEAVMNSMDVKTGKTYCAYCGAEYPLDDKAAAQVSEHIKTCEKHPMRAAEAEVARLTALSTMKDDALDSYAEFYGRAASLCGLPEDALPGSETDAIILQRLAEHDEIARLTAALEEANSALISMVYQYCYRPLDANKEPAIDIYQHDFMSAGEEAFAYLVEHGLAKWTDESHYAILINSKTSLSVKSDD